MPEDLGNPLSELGVLTAREHGPESDQWDGYPVERRRLLECVNRNTQGHLVFLSGDCHSSWAIDLKLDPEDPEQDSIGGELCTDERDIRESRRRRGLGPSDEIDRDREGSHRRQPSHPLGQTDSHGYVVVEALPERVQGDWWFVDAIHAPHPGQHHEESWMVRAEEDRIRRAPGSVS